MAVCELHDVRYLGRFFTWNNKQAGNRRVLSKIDRVLGNDLLEVNFPSAQVFVHPNGDDDHPPMLVQFLQIAKSLRPFRFFYYWTEMANFFDVLWEVWAINIVGYPSFVIS